MTRVMTPEEYAAFSGCDLERLRANIAEAEADAITRDTMDPSTLRKFNWTSETERKFRNFLSMAKEHV